MKGGTYDVARSSHFPILPFVLCLAACATGGDLSGRGRDASATVDGAATSTDAGTGVVDAALAGDAAAPEDASTTDDGGPPPSDGGPPPDVCPSGVVCVSSFPFTHSSSTRSGASAFDAYGCAPTTDESGPEIVYRVDLPEAGFLALDLPRARMAAGVDVDVHLLTSLDAGACVDRGNWRAGDYLAAGRYWVVADSWVGSDGVARAGDYALRMGFTSARSLGDEGMSARVAELALHAFGVAWEGGDTDRFEYAITDFSVPSDRPRQWVVDLATGDVLHHLFVPHGEGTNDPADSRYARTFSNVSGSHQSSLGMMRAAETYVGSYGYSMRLDGLEPGYNDAVRARAIVVHPWEGSRDTYVSAFGETAPTWGCPAIDDRISRGVIDTLSGGALLFFHFPDGDWSRHSGYLPP